jgi:hypothetical protein
VPDLCRRSGGGEGRSLMAKRAAHAEARPRRQKRDGGSLSRLQSRQEQARERWSGMGLCNLDARAAAEGRRLWCQDCQEIYDNERTTSGNAE